MAKRIVIDAEQLFDTATLKEILPKMGYVEVVRCKDCKWHEREIFLKGDYCNIWHHTTSLDAFCSHGERKEDEID